MIDENLTQSQRYKLLVKFIEENFKDDINIEKIERASLYSYRNINRIFQSIHQETIGKYVKRIRLEKAAEYIKYSDQQISDIAIEVGFSDVAAFSKAFKKKFNCSPISFRKNSTQVELIKSKALIFKSSTKVSFEIETLPEFEMLYIEHRGNYLNTAAIERTWDKLIQYCEKYQLITNEAIFFSETLDDNEITDHINCRTNIAFIGNITKNWTPTGLFRLKKHKAQQYAKFVHIGSLDNLEKTYNHIYSSWINNIQFELEDKPILEFYINHEKKTLQKDLITEIYIPIK